VINSRRQVAASLVSAIRGALVAPRVTVAPSVPLYGAVFVAGSHGAGLVGAAFVLVGAIISVVTVRKLRHEHEGAAEPAIGA
jgi:hypothetical protein